MSQATNDELIEIGERMAQELQNCCDQHGDDSAIQEVLDDWEAIWRRTDRYWANGPGDDEPSPLDRL